MSNTQINEIREIGFDFSDMAKDIESYRDQLKELLDKAELSGEQKTEIKIALGQLRHAMGNLYNASVVLEMLENV